MITSPILIIGCPRSGTTLLYNILSEAPELYSIGYESKAIIERYHHPREKKWVSSALDADDLTPESRAYMVNEFERQAVPGTFWRRVNRLRARLRRNMTWKSIKRRGRTTETGSGVFSAVPQRGLELIQRLACWRNRIIPSPDTIRLLEKTPENCLRLPFMLELFPDARVIYLTRDGRANVNSLMEGWRQPHIFPGYQVPEPVRILGDTRGRWAFTLIPGWRDLLDKPLEEVCAWQWVRCNSAVIEHRDTSQAPYLTVRYEEVIASPADCFQKIAEFIGVEFDANFGHLAEGLPLINVTSEPDREKWRRKNPQAIKRIAPIIRGVMEDLGYEGE